MYYGFVLVLVLAAGMICAAVPEINTMQQTEATALQQTIDARVNERFTQTASAREEADLDLTVDASFDIALTATAQMFRLRGGEAITLGNARRVTQLLSIPDVVQLEGMVFSPDGSMIAWIANNVLSIWDVRANTLTGTLTNQDGLIEYILFSPAGTILATASRNGVIRLWDARGGGQVGSLSNENSSIESLTFSSDGRYIASGDNNGVVRIWNTTTGDRIVLLRHDNTLPIVGLAFSADGMRIATASGDDTIRIWNIADSVQVATFMSMPSRTTRLRFSPDGTLLASVDSGVRLWNIVTGTQELSVSSRFARFNVSLLLLAVSIPDPIAPTIEIIDTTTGLLVSEVNYIGIPIDFTLDSTVLITGSTDGTIRLWQVETGEQITVLSHVSLANGITSSDGRYIATWGGDSTIRIWGVPASG